MKKIALITVAVLVLAGCQNRTIWNDSGKLEDATKDRKVWNTEGKVNSGKRKIWHDPEGNPVIQ